MSVKTMLIEDAAFWDAPMNEVRLATYLEQLKGISETDLKYAMNYFRSQPGRRQMPMPADYIQVMPDGHPSVTESWSIIPKDEESSVIWSEEMRIAYAVAAPMINQGNITGAFFAYKEAYEKAVSESRFLRRKPKWTSSFGFNKSGREGAIVEALDKKRLSLEAAVNLYPELEMSPNYERIALSYGGKKLQIEHENQEKIKQLIKPKEIG